jgi:hypothetical protein
MNANRSAAASMLFLRKLDENPLPEGHRQIPLIIHKKMKDDMEGSEMIIPQPISQEMRVEFVRKVLLEEEHSITCAFVELKRLLQYSANLDKDILSLATLLVHRDVPIELAASYIRNESIAIDKYTALLKERFSTVPFGDETTEMVKMAIDKIWETYQDPHEYHSSTEWLTLFSYFDSNANNIPDQRDSAWFYLSTYSLLNFDDVSNLIEVDSRVRKAMCMYKNTIASNQAMLIDP